VCPHVLRCAQEQGSALGSALDRLTLQAELERVYRIHAELRRHASNTTGDEFGDCAELSRVIVAFISCEKTLGCLVRAKLNQLSAWQAPRGSRDALELPLWQTRA